VFALAQPTSNEIREKIIQHKQNGATEKNISIWLIISQSTVTKVWALFRKTGSFLPKPRTQGRKPKISSEKMAEIEAKFEEQPDITLNEIIEEFNLKMTEGALSKCLKKADLTFKKRLSIRKNRSDRT